MNTKFVLILILTIALVLRIIGISNNPPSMYGDELTMVMDVNSILHTGYDTTGKFLPLNFTMGGGRPVGYGYFSLPFVAIFGPQALSIRLLSVLSGVGIVALIYLLGKILFSKQIGLLSAALIAISPWDLSLSRGGFETHFALFLATLGIVLFLMGDKKPWLYVISALSFGLSINTYATYKLNLFLFVPFLMLFVDLRVRLSSAKNRVYLTAFAIILFLFMLLLAAQALVNNSEERFLSLNVFSKSEISSQITQTVNEQRNLSTNNKLISIFLHNKYWEYGFILGESYFNNFSLDFLFLNGDRNPRHNMVSSSAFYMAESISILLGIVFLFRKGNYKRIFFLTSWLLIAPIATTLLLEVHGLRSSFMLVPLTLLSALGISYLWSIRGAYVVKPIIFILFFSLVIQFILICENLYFLSPNKYSRFWAYPAKEASEIAMKNKDKYDYIFLADRIDAVEFAYPVYAFLEPTKILEQNRNKLKIGENQFRKYGNIYIGSISDNGVESFLESFPGTKLYIGPEGDGKYLNSKFDTILGKDLVRALVVLEVKK